MPTVRPVPQLLSQLPEWNQCVGVGSAPPPPPLHTHTYTEAGLQIKDDCDFNPMSSKKSLSLTQTLPSLPCTAGGDALSTVLKLSPGPELWIPSEEEGGGGVYRGGACS